MARFKSLHSHSNSRGASALHRKQAASCLFRTMLPRQADCGEIKFKRDYKKTTTLRLNFFGAILAPSLLTVIFCFLSIAEFDSPFSIPYINLQLYQNSTAPIRRQYFKSLQSWNGGQLMREQGGGGLACTHLIEEWRFGCAESGVRRCARGGGGAQGQWRVGAGGSRWLDYKLMGECISKSSAMKPPAEVSCALQREGALGIQLVESTETSLKFVHSPLTACVFLYEKFCNNSAAPEQVNLNFMLVGVAIDPAENLVTLTLINQNPINVYLVLGGTEMINNTGLTVEIARIKYFEKLTRTEPSPPRGEEITLVPAKMAAEPIFLILEPLLKTAQTMFIVNRYAFAEPEKAYRRKSQTLQWSNLAFDLQDIYGGEALFKCDAGEQCSVCLSAPANVFLTPCRHMCLCQDCARTYQKSSKKCPICRTEFRATVGYK